MSPKSAFINYLKLLFPFSIFLLLFSCASPNLSQFEVQRPSRISVPREVKRVFIRSDLVKSSNDKLKLKKQILNQLAKELNELGRFQVQVVESFDEASVDAEKDTVAVIQGEVSSGGEVDQGQFTDLATCTGGISGRLSSAGAASLTGESITLDSWRGYVCREGSFAGDVAQVAISTVLVLAGLGQAIPPKNQVIRVYQYKNLSLYAQANFSFTIIGSNRETLAIRADAASFGRNIKQKNSFKNVQESHLVAQTLGRAITYSKLPIFPIPVRSAALAEKSNPRRTFYTRNPLPVPNVKDLVPGEKDKVIRQLVARTLVSFVRMISPYRVKVGAEVASGGQANAGTLLKEGKAKLARQQIENLALDSREPADWYNLGLAYEASAISVEDYEDARRFYITALEKSPGNALFAQGVGRTRTYLSEAKKLALQKQ